MTKRFSVEEWGSHPDQDNDDCYSGEDFDTIEEARACFAKGTDDRDIAYLVLNENTGSHLDKMGRTIVECELRDIWKNPKHRKTPDDDSEWRNERAMQAGMMGGCEAYNDEMGY